MDVASHLACVTTTVASEKRLLAGSSNLPGMASEMRPYSATACYVGPFQSELSDVGRGGDLSENEGATVSDSFFLTW
jgi:hypothetical protein